MSDSEKIRSLEDELLQQLAFIPPDLETSNLGSILRTSRKYVSNNFVLLAKFAKSTKNAELDLFRMQLALVLLRIYFSFKSAFGLLTTNSF